MLCMCVRARSVTVAHHVNTTQGDWWGGGGRGSGVIYSFEFEPMATTASAAAAGATPSGPALIHDINAAIRYECHG